MNEAVAYKDEVARIGLQRGPSEKPVCHMNTNMMKKALLSNSHNIKIKNCLLLADHQFIQ
jgi:hypothetical protein